MWIGDGAKPTKSNNMVKIPNEVEIPWWERSYIHNIIQDTFSQLENHVWDASYMVETTIITPNNCDMQILNDIIIDQFPGEEHNFLSFDEVEGDTRILYQQEYLNTIVTGSLLPHILKIKKGVPLMLLRNRHPKYGL